MKKFIALFLVLVLAFSFILVSCDKEGEGNVEEPSESDDNLGLNPFFTTGTGTGTGTGSATPIGKTHTDFQWTDDPNGTTVYVAVDRLSVRSDTNASTNDTYKYTACFGESYKRIRYNEYWTQIDYKGNQYYVSSEYVTTDNGKITFTPDAAESTVYVIAYSLTLRSCTYVDETTIKTHVSKGGALTRIATSADGSWIKVRITYTPYGETTPKTEELYCNASSVSADAGAAVTTSPASLG